MPIDEATRQAPPPRAGHGIELVPALTLLAHGHPSRVGERATLLGLAAGEAVSLSRTAPMFAPVEGGVGAGPRPIADPFLSRDPLATIVHRDGAVRVRREKPGALVRLDGVDLEGERALTPDELDRGVVIELGGRVVLLLHRVDAVVGRTPPRFDLVGCSDAMRRLRKDIARVATTDMRVLVRGETGAGKELVARAVHGASARASSPYVAVNMGAVQPSLAASALFGHVRGAFSGAVTDHDGHFVAADRGTLFLDEIGDTDASVQAMLLRTLETSEVQRIGDRRVRKVDVRLLTATDADLEAEVARGRFREPLLHRIGELTLRVPPLRARRDDLGLLLVHFLRDLLDDGEKARLLADEFTERPWLSAEVVARLARAPWTGNVRQLRNVVRQLVVLGRDEPELSIGPEIEATLGEPALPSSKREGEASSPAAESTGASGDPPAGSVVPRSKGKRPADLTEEDVLDALARSGWKRGPAAELLGIARSSLYAIIAANKRLVRAHDLTREQLEEALARAGGDIARAAEELKVSEHAIKLRLQALGAR
ncbi:MAG: sigma-54-dependent Fis family transcriptional regulator [Deltaproteobacteria bacterium]|nr:sigma-54-dependent Fis family transcriptional regulator [Deltaproteobacteria bacterium]